VNKENMICSCKHFPLGEKTDKQGGGGETNLGEAKALGIPDLPTILPFDPLSYIMFSHNEIVVLWL
jgi:hypothetical protein